VVARLAWSLLVDKQVANAVDHEPLGWSQHRLPSRPRRPSALVAAWIELFLATVAMLVVLLNLSFGACLGLSLAINDALIVQCTYGA